MGCPFIISGRGAATLVLAQKMEGWRASCVRGESRRPAGIGAGVSGTGWALPGELSVKTRRVLPGHGAECRTWEEWFQGPVRGLVHAG